MRLVYDIKGDAALLRVQPGLMDAFGALKSPKAGGDFRKAREAGTLAWMREAARKR
jgi:hypothetical protein